MKDLPKVPTWRLEQDSNPQLSSRKASTIPVRHHAAQCLRSYQLPSCSVCHSISTCLSFSLCPSFSVCLCPPYVCLSVFVCHSLSLSLSAPLSDPAPLRIPSKSVNKRAINPKPTFPSAARRMESDLMSRWITPLECRKASALRQDLQMVAICSSFNLKPIHSQQHYNTQVNDVIDN